jgi:hypothetical protein
LVVYHLVLSVSLLFAFSAKNINDVWAWIIMGLGGGMIFPQLLPLYWSRFNGIGYSVDAHGVTGRSLPAQQERIFPLIVVRKY